MKKMSVWGPLSPLGLGVAALAFGLDQTVKWYLLYIVDMPQRQGITVAPFFDIVMAWNHGVSYGMFTSRAQMPLIAFSMVMSLVLWMWLSRSTRPVTATALGLIIGGALGNCIDRITHGAVADFFSFHWNGWNWYVFNPADVAIVAGVGLLLYESIKDPKKI